MLVQTVTCLEGEVEIELICEPAFDYGRAPAEWKLADGSRHPADAGGAPDAAIPAVERRGAQDAAPLLRPPHASGVVGDLARSARRRCRSFAVARGAGLI
jgi:hypothetical protein